MPIKVVAILRVYWISARQMSIKSMVSQREFFFKSIKIIIIAEGKENGSLYLIKIGR